MTLLLDGQKVQGKNLKVTGNLRIESGDMSGQTSNTDSAHKGFKPKTLTVTLLIRFIDGASYLACNDYEFEVVMDRTGLSLGDIAARLEALIVTRGGQKDRLIPPRGDIGINLETGDQI